MNKYYCEIDLIKAIAIICVLIMHTWDYNLIMKTYAFHITQAVPVFMVIMGLNLGINSEKNIIFSKRYFIKKINRIILPFIFIFILSAFEGLFFYLLKHKAIVKYGLINLYGILPISGPGNYFISITIQSIIVLPILKYNFDKNKKYTLISTFLISLVFELLSPSIYLFHNNIDLYQGCILRYIFHICLGMWLAKNVEHTLNKNNLIILFTSMVSLIILYKYQFFNFRFSMFMPNVETENLLIAPYSALLVIVLFYIFSIIKQNQIISKLSIIGKASYHIFLVQIIYFTLGLTPYRNNSFAMGMCIIFINIVCGVIFYYFDKCFNNYMGKFKN